MISINEQDVSRRLPCQQIDELRENICVNHRLDLLGCSGGDVGDRPACLLADVLLWTFKHPIIDHGKKRYNLMDAMILPKEGRKSIQVDNELGLAVISSNDVANCSQRRCLYGR